VISLKSAACVLFHSLALSRSLFLSLDFAKLACFSGTLSYLLHLTVDLLRSLAFFAPSSYILFNHSETLVLPHLSFALTAWMMTDDIFLSYLCTYSRLFWLLGFSLHSQTVGRGRQLAYWRNRSDLLEKPHELRDGADAFTSCWA
jgi:hypothetical protein